MESGEFFVHACTHFLYTFKKVCTKRVQMPFFTKNRYYYVNFFLEQKA